MHFLIINQVIKAIITIASNIQKTIDVNKYMTAKYINILIKALSHFGILKFKPRINNTIDGMAEAIKRSNLSSQ